MNKKEDTQSINITDWIEERYAIAMTKASGKEEPTSYISPDTKSLANEIIKAAESSKAAYTVILTCLIYKILNQEQDIRNHQVSIPGGFSGRTFDSNYITPFLRKHDFPCMAESGWLTRSFEHKVPYTLDYNGAIKPQKLKDAFLRLIDIIENSPDGNEALLDYLLQGIIIERDHKTIQPAIPRNLSISNIISLLDSHFHEKYNAVGAARLPVLAIYAIYQCLFDEGQKRFTDKVLLHLENHNSADTQSGRIGDIDVVDKEGNTFEAVEVKFDIHIDINIVERAKEKILRTTATRYYILSTVTAKEEDTQLIAEAIDSISKTHGCQMIINGILPTLKYYLRLLESHTIFTERYAQLVFSDPTIKFEHKQMWNQLVSKL